MADAFHAGVQDLHAVVPFFRELVFLKRVRSAGRAGSLAQRLFLRAWAELAGGAALRHVTARITGAALAALRLGDLDEAALHGLGIESAPVLRRASAEFAHLVDPALLHDMAAPAGGMDAPAEPPAFARALAEQPRAGITSPGLPRVAFAFTENHAEHCLSVAVGGAVLAARFGADAAAVFLAGLAHHFHNAFMADSGFAGEMLLGEYLAPAIEAAHARAGAELPDAIAQTCLRLRREIATDATPLARAFHAADVLDRVLEAEACLAASRLTMKDVLERYALVHEGAVKPFHDQVLRCAGLAC